MKKFDKIILLLLSVIYLIPVAITIFKSFEYNDSISLNQYRELFINNYPVFHYYWNSAMYAIISSICCIIISLPLAFLFSKTNFRFRDCCFMVFVIVMMMPFQATMLPNYILFRNIHMLNTPLAIALPMIFSPLGVFLLRQFIKSIPDEQVHAALLETSSLYLLFKYIIIPQIRPAIVTLFILLFCESWNIYEQVLVLSPQNDYIYPLSSMFSQMPDNIKFSSSVIYLFPVIILFLLFENTLYSGMGKYKL